MQDILERKGIVIGQTKTGKQRIEKHRVVFKTLLSGQDDRNCWYHTLFTDDGTDFHATIYDRQLARDAGWTREETDTWKEKGYHEEMTIIANIYYVQRSDRWYVYYVYPKGTQE